jgi:hypothetical protein
MQGEAIVNVRRSFIVIAITAILPMAGAAAQEIGAPYDRSELARWIKAYEKWDKWDEQWLNKLERARHGGYLDRKTMPPPPVWLDSTCAGLFEADPLLEQACALLRQSHETLGQTYMRRHRQAAIDAHERPTHTSFLEYVHFDGGWITPSNARAYAPIGTHVSVMLGDRYELFMLPGVLFVRAPSYASGTMEWFVAYDYGFGFRLTTFQMPGVGQKMIVHFNLARAWIPERTASGPVTGTIDLVGFSLTFKNRSSR